MRRVERWLIAVLFLSILGAAGIKGTQAAMADSAEFSIHVRIGYWATPTPLATASPMPTLTVSLTPTATHPSKSPTPTATPR